MRSATVRLAAATRLAATVLLAAFVASPAFAEGLPVPAGSYVSSKESPRVFDTPEMLRSLAKRVGQPGSFSAKMYEKLARQAAADISDQVDWDATYSGCDIDIYLHAFSFESTGGYAQERRTAAQMSDALHVQPGKKAPAGAAVVAGRLALYAALRASGAPQLPKAPAPEDAIRVSSRILAAWAEHGFREGAGLKSQPQQFCEGGRSDATVQSGVGLQVARGVVYSVQAQDLLNSQHALSAQSTRSLNAFHAAMYALIRNASNFAAGPAYRRPDEACGLYSNHRGAHLMALLAIARLLDDPKRFDAALYGGAPGVPVTIGWTEQFDHAIYGQHDRPIGCYKNNGKDSLTSHPSFQTGVVAPGEVMDRYRHDNPEQSIGYAMFALLNLNFGAMVLENAGFDPYGYRGRHGQSLELATAYYACYARHVGFGKRVSADNARECADYQQYIGQDVNEVEKNVLLGARNFPQDAAITAVEAAARERPDGQSLDPILFGRWRD